MLEPISSDRKRLAIRSAQPDNCSAGDSRRYGGLWWTSSGTWNKYKSCSIGDAASGARLESLWRMTDGPESAGASPHGGRSPRPPVRARSPPLSEAGMIDARSRPAADNHAAGWLPQSRTGDRQDGR